MNLGFGPLLREHDLFGPHLAGDGSGFARAVDRLQLLGTWPFTWSLGFGRLSDTAVGTKCDVIGTGKGATPNNTDCNR